MICFCGPFLCFVESEFIILCPLFSDDDGRFEANGGHEITEDDEGIEQDHEDEDNSSKSNNLQVSISTACCDFAKKKLDCFIIKNNVGHPPI